MQLIVFTAVALCGLVIGYAAGVGGAVSTLIFLAILFTGAFLRVARPLLDRLRA